MKTFALALLWCLALVLAVGVLWRVARRRPVVLRGRWSPRLVQMVAVLVLAVTDARRAEPVLAEDAPPQGPAGKADLEIPLSKEAVSGWRRQYALRGGHPALTKQIFARLESGAVPPTADIVQKTNKRLGSLPRPLKEIMRADLSALGAGKPLPTQEAPALIAALDAMEQAGCVDNWFLGYLWRITGRDGATRDRAADAKLYARFARHAVIHDALVRARASSGVTRFNPRSWMSKGGPSKRERTAESVLVERLWAAYRKAYGEIGKSTWQMDALAEFGLRVDSAPAILLRRGQRTPLKPGLSLFRLGRLDLLETPSKGDPVTLAHVWLGDVTLPMDAVVSVWELPALLGGDARARVASTVADALQGDKAAALQLEAALPLCHAELARQLRAAPKAKGAARLRTLLVLFDERVALGP